MTQLTTRNFDYSVVDKDTKSELIYYAAQILKARDAIGKSTIEMGGHLAAAQERLADHSGGTFTRWVETECAFSERTAYNLINAYRVFGSFANFAKLEDSAMYALASNGTPEKARREAMKLADKGVAVTHAKAREIIAKHKESSSDKGKPGGEGSSPISPVADSPASATAADSEDLFDADSDSARETGPENGASDRSHTVTSPAAESVPDSEDPPPPRNGKAGKPHDPDEVFKTEKSRAVKTAEALIRCVDDLHELKHNPKHDSLVATCKSLVATFKAW